MRWGALIFTIGFSIATCSHAADVRSIRKSPEPARTPEHAFNIPKPEELRQLRPESPVADLIAMLDADDAQTRNKAIYDLRWIGERAIPQLQEAEKRGASPQIKDSAGRLLKEMTAPLALEWDNEKIAQDVFSRFETAFEETRREMCRQLWKFRSRFKKEEIEKLVTMLKAMPDGNETLLPEVVALLEKKGFETVAWNLSLDICEKGSRCVKLDTTVFGSEKVPTFVLKAEEPTSLPLIESTPGSVRRRPQFPEVPVQFGDGTPLAALKDVKANFYQQGVNIALDSNECSLSPAHLSLEAPPEIEEKVNPFQTFWTDSGKGYVKARLR